MPPAAEPPELDVDADVVVVVDVVLLPDVVAAVDEVDPVEAPTVVVCAGVLPPLPPAPPARALVSSSHARKSMKHRMRDPIEATSMRWGPGESSPVVPFTTSTWQVRPS